MQYKIKIKGASMQTQIQNLIIDSLKNLADELENEELKNPTKETKIYGIEGNLDSLALVSFVADLEQSLSAECDIEITLADEKTMSMRNSPFRDVETLTQYICDYVAGGAITYETSPTHHWHTQRYRQRLKLTLFAARAYCMWLLQKRGQYSA